MSICASGRAQPPARGKRLAPWPNHARQGSVRCDGLATPHPHLLAVAHHARPGALLLGVAVDRHVARDLAHRLAAIESSRVAKRRRRTPTLPLLQADAPILANTLKVREACRYSGRMRSPAGDAVHERRLAGARAALRERDHTPECARMPHTVSPLTEGELDCEPARRSWGRAPAGGTGRGGAQRAP